MDHLLDNDCLLGILLTKIGCIRLDYIKEFCHHRSNPFKMSRAGSTAEDVTQGLYLNISGIPIWIYFFNSRIKQDICTSTFCQSLILLKIPGIFLIILMGSKLDRVHKYT